MAAKDFVLVPTKPRGPIAAMYKSPGPCYGLPNLTGVSAHDPRSIHVRKPAYSFGVRHGKVRDDCSPGPCYLPDSKMSRIGKGGAPEFSLYSRNREPTMFKTPGPGSYKPESAGKASRLSHSACTFSCRPKYIKKDHTPAANSYTLPNMTGTTYLSGKRQAPCFTFQGRQKTGGFAEDLCKTPGPGAYSTTDPNISKSKAPLFSMAGRGTLPGDTTQKPGPGAHSPQNVWLDKRKTPEFSFGIRHIFSIMPVDMECSVNNGLVPNMTSCRDFLICINGKVVRRIPCARGLLFDTNIDMCNYERVVSCGERPIQGFEKCYIVKVNVTIMVENSIKEPKFTLKTHIHAQRQPLYYFLLMAAGKDNRFSFNTTRIENYGEFVLSFNGLVGSEKTFTVWIPSDRRNNGIKQGIHEFYPEDNEVITYKYYSFSDNLQESNFKNTDIESLVT